MGQRKQKAWIISANMGYGHDRAAHGLEEIAVDNSFITSNTYPGIPKQDRKLWKETRTLYETISRLKPVPILGHLLFEAMDRFQEIPPFYPRRDLSDPNLQLQGMYRFIKKGLGRHLTDKLNKDPRPVVCTFPLTAFAMEYHGYSENIYVVVTDTDMSRAWVPLDPKKSKLQYLAPTGRVVERLKLYGVSNDRIFHTGFPLPKSIIGGTDSTIAKKDIARRICNLDPNGIFLNRYWRTLRAELGLGSCLRLKSMKRSPVTVTFAVGGAGAQKQIGAAILRSLREKIRRKEMRLILVAGTRKVVGDYFIEHARQARLGPELGKGVVVYYNEDRHAYFHGFDKILRETDILWTKPSELSFYTGAGIPILMAPPVGSQEEFNKLWLLNVGGGIAMHEPETCDEWLTDWIQSGALARMAWNGYIEAPTHGTYRIESIITGVKVEVEQLPLIV